MLTNLDLDNKCVYLFFNETIGSHYGFFLSQGYNY